MFVACTPNKKKNEKEGTQKTQISNENGEKSTRSYKANSEELKKKEQQIKARTQDSLRQVKAHGHSH